MRPFTGQITTKSLPPHTYCVRSPRGIRRPVFYSWTRWQNFSVFLGHHVLQASGGESTKPSSHIGSGYGTSHTRRHLQLMGSRTENQAKPATVNTRRSPTQVLQSVCEDVLESGEKRFHPLNIPCWLSLTAEGIHADHHRF